MPIDEHGPASPGTAFQRNNPFPYIRALALPILIMGFIVYVSVKLAPGITRLVSQPDKFRDLMDAYGPLGALIFMLLQAAHIAIVIIPGEMVQIAGGYVFGTTLGTLYSVIGTVIGSILVFGASRLLGFGAVKALISRDHLAKFNFLLNNPRAEILMFVMFLIPGFPKDTLLYIAGLTPVKPLQFLLISTIARLPGLWGSAYIGANLHEKDYLPVWILSGVALLMFVMGILAKDRIVDKLHRLQRVVTRTDKQPD
jgi:uncharacterized membrane protein YdjX (TVP38/TMEM64 family)